MWEICIYVIRMIEEVPFPGSSKCLGRIRSKICRSAPVPYKRMQVHVMKGICSICIHFSNQVVKTLVSVHVIVLNILDTR